MRTLTKVSDDKVLNQILKSRRTKNFKILYYSLWDDSSTKIIKLAEEWANEEGDETMYLVNSWDLPQSFAAFSITSVPTIVHVQNKKVRVDVEYPKVYSFFTVGRPKTP